MALRRSPCSGGCRGLLAGPFGQHDITAKDSALTTSGLPVPRYVSLKSDHVADQGRPDRGQRRLLGFTCSGSAGRNHRGNREQAPGPGFPRAAEGWVPPSMLSGRRIYIVTMKSRTEWRRWR